MDLLSQFCKPDYRVKKFFPFRLLNNKQTAVSGAIFERFFIVYVELVWSRGNETAENSLNSAFVLFQADFQKNPQRYVITRNCKLSTVTIIK